MLMSDEQKAKYDFFTVELSRMLTIMRNEPTAVKYYIKNLDTEIVEIYDKNGVEIASTDVTLKSLLVAVHSILVMLLFSQ